MQRADDDNADLAQSGRCGEARAGAWGTAPATARRSLPLDLDKKSSGFGLLAGLSRWTAHAGTAAAAGRPKPFTPYLPLPSAPVDEDGRGISPAFPSDSPPAPLPASPPNPPRRWPAHHLDLTSWPAADSVSPTMAHRRVGDYDPPPAGPPPPPGVPHPLQLGARSAHHHPLHDPHLAAGQQQVPALQGPYHTGYPVIHQRQNSNPGPVHLRQSVDGGTFNDDGSAAYPAGDDSGDYPSTAGEAPDRHSRQHYEASYASSPAYAHSGYNQAPVHPFYSRLPPASATTYAHPAYGSTAHPPSSLEAPLASAGSRPPSSYGAGTSHDDYTAAPPPLQHPAYAQRAPPMSQPLPPMSLVPDEQPSSMFRYSPQTGPLPSISQAHQSAYGHPQQQLDNHRAEYQHDPNVYPSSEAFGYAPPTLQDDNTVPNSYQDSGLALHSTSFPHPAYARASTATHPPPPSLSINTSFARPSTSHAAPISTASASAQGSQASPWAGPPPPTSLSLGGLAQRRRSATDALLHGHASGYGGLAHSYGRRPSHEEEERRRASLASPLSRSLGPTVAHGGGGGGGGSGSGSGSGAGRGSIDYTSARSASGLVGPASAGQSPEMHGDHQLGAGPSSAMSQSQSMTHGAYDFAGPGSSKRSPHLRFAPPPPPQPTSVSARERRASGDREGAVASVAEEDEEEGGAETENVAEEGGFHRMEEREDEEAEGTAHSASERTSRAASVAGSRASTPVKARRASAASGVGIAAGTFDVVGGGKRRRMSAPGMMAAELDEEDDYGDEDDAGAGGRRREPASKKFICPHPSCGRAFARNFNLMSHIKSHQGIREFKCPECNKLFSRKHDCTRHCIAIHHYDKDGRAPVGKQPVYVAQEILPVGVMVERAKERQRAVGDASSSGHTPLLSGSRPLGPRLPLLSTGAEPVLLHPPPLSATPSSASSTSTPPVPTPLDGRPPVALQLPPPHHHLQHPAYPPPPPPAQPRYAGAELTGGSPPKGFAPPAPPQPLQHPRDWSD